MIPPAPETTIADDNNEAARHLLAWYDRHRRVLPWRVEPYETPDPYRVWLSEIMLQQTTVTAVTPYFEAFVARWPDVGALADASLDEVLHAWQGLGYYARARNLHRCARVVAGEMDGAFPRDERGLRALPGIGTYTGAAISAIAFERRAVVVDGNVERVMARLFAIEDPLPGAKPVLYERADRLTPAARPGDYAQAVMDLGATVCTPRKPRCEACPVARQCLAWARGIAATLPVRTPKPVRPVRRGVVFVALNSHGAVLLRRRPERGLLGGMMELPSTDWRGEPWSFDEAVQAAPLQAAWRELPGSVRHTFTHFHLELLVLVGNAGAVGCKSRPVGIWCPPDRLSEQALPSVMKKVFSHALENPVAGTALFTVIAEPPANRR